MLRYCGVIFMIICLLGGSLHAGHDQAVADAHEAGGCLISAGSGSSMSPSHDDTHSSDGDHCCDTHTQLQAVTSQLPAVLMPSQTKQFTAVVPHLVPRDFSRIPFKPPRSDA